MSAHTGFDGPDCAQPTANGLPCQREEGHIGHHLTTEEPGVGGLPAPGAGSLEYDADNRWLVFTELIGPDEYGNAAIVAENVPAWFGSRLLQALPWPGSDGGGQTPAPALPPADPVLISGTPENKAWHRARAR